MTFRTVIERFSAHRNGSGWVAECPAHEDGRPSLSIKPGDKGGTVLFCQAGCATEAVLAAKGLAMADLRPERTEAGKPQITATYDYIDEQDTLLYQVVRFSPKNFRQRRPDGSGGWLWKLDEVRRVLFGLPTLRGQKVVYIVEGEKDVLSLRAIGLVATCNAGGAGKWTADYTAQLTAAGVASVVMLPDNDPPGGAHAAEVAASCHAAGLTVKIVKLPDLPAKGDVSDWLAGGHTRDELIVLVKAAPIYDAAANDAAPTHFTEPVDLATILTDVERFIHKYIVVTREAAVLMALWVTQTHVMEAFDYVAYLHVKSPLPECGKTRLLEVLEALVAKPWLTGRVTAAVLMRKVDAVQPVLLLDESDAAFNGDEQYAEGLRGILNTGFHREGRASVCVGQGANLTYKDFSTFGPKAIAGIGRLPSTVESRSIPIALRRRTKEEVIAKWRRREAWAAAEPLRTALVAVAGTSAATLRHARPALPDGLSDRAEDVLEPLFALADFAGGDWSPRARHAAVRLMGFSARVAQEADQNIALELLSDIHTIFEAAEDNPEALPTAEIIKALVGFEDRPWATYTKGDKPITAHRLRRLLKEFDVQPAGDIRFDNKVLKGYRRAAFADAFARYLPFEGQQRNKPNAPGSQITKMKARHEPSVADSTMLVSPDRHYLCSAVALSNPEHGDGADDGEDDDAYFGA